MADIDDDDPKHWADLPKHEREALIEFARLSVRHRERIYKAGANIAFWDTLFEKVGKWKSLAFVIAFASVVAGLLTGLFDSIVGSRQ